MPLVRLAAQKRWNLKLIIVIGGLRCACHRHLGNLWALWLARLDARFMPRPGIGLRLWNIALAAQANAGQPLESMTRATMKARNRRISITLANARSS